MMRSAGVGRAFRGRRAVATRVAHASDSGVLNGRAR